MFPRAISFDADFLFTNEPKPRQLMMITFPAGVFAEFSPPFHARELGFQYQASSPQGEPDVFQRRIGSPGTA
jgi:hypothetical protein